MAWLYACRHWYRRKHRRNYDQRITHDTGRACPPRSKKAQAFRRFSLPFRFPFPPSPYRVLKIILLKSKMNTRTGAENDMGLLLKIFWNF